MPPATPPAVACDICDTYPIGRWGWAELGPEHAAGHPNRPIRTEDTGKVHVLVLVVETPHGNWARVFKTQGTLTSGLAGWVREQWEEAISGQEVDEEDQIPDNEQEMIDSYFDGTSDCYYWTDEAEVED